MTDDGPTDPLEHEGIGAPRTEPASDSELPARKDDSPGDDPSPSRAEVAADVALNLAKRASERLVAPSLFRQLVRGHMRAVRAATRTTDGVIRFSIGFFVAVCVLALIAFLAAPSPIYLIIILGYPAGIGGGLIAARWPKRSRFTTAEEQAIARAEAKRDRLLEALDMDYSELQQAPESDAKRSRLAELDRRRALIHDRYQERLARLLYHDEEAPGEPGERPSTRPALAAADRNGDENEGDDEGPDEPSPRR